MKKSLLLPFLLVLILASAQAQDKVVYFNAEWKKCSEVEASYKRIIKDLNENSPLYHVTDYYIAGGKQMEGQFSDKKLSKKEGIFTYYYRNGQIKETITYKNNRKRGPMTLWSEKGDLILKGAFYAQKIGENYITGKKIFDFYDSTGTQLVKAGEGHYYEYVNGNLYYASGPILDGLKQGIWTGYDTLINATYTETYGQNELIKGRSKDQEGNIYPYETMTVSAELKGGVKQLYSYISRKIEYPKVAQQLRISGVVYVQFKITKEGEMTDIHVVKGIEPDCDAEAFRVISSFRKKWTPGLRRGQKVVELRVLPVRFILQ